MNELKIYSVSDAYIEYLRKSEYHVYSNKIDERTHTRKYVGVVIKISDHNYYVPLSSPKDSDYKVVNGIKTIRKSIVPIYRIIVKNSKGIEELKGTLRISHMIPVPDSELELYDYNNESDQKYKDLVHNEMIVIRKNQDKIISNAKLLYKQKLSKDETAGYVEAALDYSKLESLCDKYNK